MTTPTLRKATTRMRAAILTLATLAPLTAPSGCSEGAFDWSFLFPGKSRSDPGGPTYTDPLSDSAAYRDTVAEHAYFEGLRRLRVRGYGIVVGLGDTGSRQCQKRVADQLIQEMYKTRKFAERQNTPVTPERLLRDPDTAVVTIEGEIPAGATTGQRFDLVVRAVPGTDTTSIEGGTLFECNLSIFRQLGSTGWIPGKTVATGAGPIFVNPFGRSDNPATKPNLRQGTVIGGGIVRENRRLRLILSTPSYPLAIQIADAVNMRFAAGGDRVADAVSPAEIKITVPEDYRHDPRHFVAVVQHIYPRLRPEFLAERTRELAREFEKADAPHVEIALAWEAIGRNALPTIRSFYTHPRPECSFYAAAAGLLLGDDMAVETIEKHLFKKSGRHRTKAIRVMAAARHSARAARPLRKALDDPDPRIRTLAYEALRQRDDPTITTIPIEGGGFHLDLVPSEGPKLIYVKRTQAPVIAFFGKPIEARPPLFYSAPGNELIIDAPPGAENLTVVRRAPVSGAVSPPIQLDLDVPRLVAFLGQAAPKNEHEPLRGVGIDYAGITRALAKLCEAKSIPARFILETPDDPLEQRTIRPAGRREADF